METPLEGNKFIGELQKARKAGKSEFVVDGKTYQVEGSAIKMVDQMNPSLVQAVDPMSGMPQPNQMNPSMVNPQALGSIQNRIPNVSGNQIPGSFNRVMPAAPLNNKIKDVGRLNATGFATGSAAGAAVGNIENVLGKAGKDTKFMGSGPVPPKKPSRSKIGQKVASESKK
jgi:hypothetical protein|tara:strand:- start:362 stop:874 length:513 start_codon:yes stop_codon:yes gene_type:complete